MTRVGLGVLTLLVAWPGVRADDKEAEKQAILQAQLQRNSILAACEAYHASPQNKTGAHPTILPELVKPPFGGSSFLRNGEKDLVDPWGKMFQYAVAKDEKGNLRPYVWTERTVDGKTTVIGTKTPEPKKK
jgi:hypothetical protein